MSENTNEIMQPEENNYSIESKASDLEKDNVEMEDSENNDGRSAFLTDDFRCGELLLEADEDREAFKLFFRVAVEEKRQDAIDKLLFIALKNSHNAELLEDETWKEIKNLSRKGKGYEYAYLLLHFKYYSKSGHKDNEEAYKYLVSYFKCCKDHNSEILPIADLQMGKCLDFGVGIPAEQVDAAEALKYYQKALEGGCLAAYKYIVCSFLYGADNLKKDEEHAKQKLEKAIELFKNHEKRNEIKPFFEDLVDCCFLFQNKKIREKMINKGKALAQYMIDNNIKGGYRLMGDFFLYSNKGFNMTMAKNYYRRATRTETPCALLPSWTPA